MLQPNVAFYVRSATNSLSEVNGLSHRTKEICQYMELLKTHGVLVDTEINVYRDQGSGNTIDHPGIKILLRDIRKKKISAVIVTDLNRISRNLVQLLKFLMELKRNHVELYVVDQGLKKFDPIFTEAA